MSTLLWSKNKIFRKFKISRRLIFYCCKQSKVHTTLLFGQMAHALKIWNQALTSKRVWPHCIVLTPISSNNVYCRVGHISLHISISSLWHALFSVTFFLSFLSDKETLTLKVASNYPEKCHFKSWYAQWNRN